MKPVLKLGLVLLLSLQLTACQTMGSGGTKVVDTFCLTYKPISWSKSDTRLTQEQIVEVNAIWKKRCNK